MSQGLFYKFSKPGIKDSYLFGTVHSSDSELVKLSKQVKQAFKHAKTVALEIDLTDKEQQINIDLRAVPLKAMNQYPATHFTYFDEHTNFFVDKQRIFAGCQIVQPS